MNPDISRLNRLFLVLWGMFFPCRCMICPGLCTWLSFRNADFYLQLWVSLHRLSATLAFYTVSRIRVPVYLVFSPKSGTVDRGPQCSLYLWTYPSECTRRSHWTFQCVSAGGIYHGRACSCNVWGYVDRSRCHFFYLVWILLGSEYVTRLC